MSDYQQALNAVVAQLKQDAPFRVVERIRCKRCGRTVAAVLRLDGQSLYQCMVRHDRGKYWAELAGFARFSGGRAPKRTPDYVQHEYALVDHPDRPDLPVPWCPHRSDAVLYSPR